VSARTSCTGHFKSIPASAYSPGAGLLSLLMQDLQTCTSSLLSSKDAQHPTKRLAQKQHVAWATRSQFVASKICRTRWHGVWVYTSVAAFFLGRGPREGSPFTFSSSSVFTSAFFASLLASCSEPTRQSLMGCICVFCHLAKWGQHNLPAGITTLHTWGEGRGSAHPSITCVQVPPPLISPHGIMSFVVGNAACGKERRRGAGQGEANVFHSPSDCGPSFSPSRAHSTVLIPTEAGISTLGSWS